MSGRTSLFARGVAVAGEAALVWRRWTQGPMPPPAVGGAPRIPPGRPQGAVPTLKMPTARGWASGQTPVAAPGLAVNVMPLRSAVLSFAPFGRLKVNAGAGTT